MARHLELRPFSAICCVHERFSSSRNAFRYNRSTASATDFKLSSSVGFKGICKKVLIIMLVGVAHIVDLHVVGTGNALRGAVVCFYLSNEDVSLLENAAHLGLPIPEKMKSILAQLHNRIDDTTTDQGRGE